MSEVFEPIEMVSGRFGQCHVWTDGSLAPDDAHIVLHKGERGGQKGGQGGGDGDPALTLIARGGRGSAWRLNVNGQAAVLRQYRRGGMMAQFNRDLYCWRGGRKTRAYREFTLMARLSEAGLAVPCPLAAMACRVSGLFYRAAILTRFVDHVGALCAVKLPPAWYRAGQVIARLHRAGVWHADLNVHNILVNADNQVWLIDFDRAREGVTDDTQLQANLSRLLRSVRKVCPELEQGLWPVLLEGYKNPS